MGYIGACLVRNIGLFSCCVVPRQPGLVGVSVSSYPGSLVSVPPVGIFIDWKVGCRITPDRLQFCLFVLSVEQWSKMNITLWRSVRKCIEALAATFSHCICILSRHPFNNNCQATKPITHETRAGGQFPSEFPVGPGGFSPERCGPVQLRHEAAGKTRGVPVTAAGPSVSACAMSRSVTAATFISVDTTRRHQSPVITPERPNLIRVAVLASSGAGRAPIRRKSVARISCVSFIVTLFSQSIVGGPISS